MKSKTTAYLLWFFLGGLGIHKFYLGKHGMGIVYLLTGGICGIGWLVDLFTLGGQVDAYNALFMSQQALLTGQSQQQTVVVNVGTPAPQAPAAPVAAPASAVEPQEAPLPQKPELPSDVAEEER